MTRALESKAEKIAHLRQRIAQIPARSVTAPDPSPVIATPRRTHPEESPAALASAPALGTLPTPAPIADLLPHHGLVRGSTVQVSGAAALRVGLVASVTGAGGWAAIVGRPKFGLLAAAEMGADLARCAIIPDAGDDPAAVAAVLVDGVDVVLLSLGGADVPPSRARAVTARARRNGAVLVVTDGRWPAIDLQLDARVAGHRGLGTNGGRITGLDLEVEARPRGQRPRRATVAITGQSGDVTWATTQIDPTPLKIAQ